MLVAYASFTNIRKAVRERMEAALSSTRDIASGRFDGEYYTNMQDQERRLLSLITPRYDVRIVGASRHESSPTINSTLALMTIELDIICSYALATPAEADDTRDVVRATAEQDADIIRQALTFPNNIDDTSAAAATGLVSGRLEWNGFEVTREEWGEGTDDAMGILETAHHFEGIINIAQAAS